MTDGMLFYHENYETIVDYTIKEKEFNIIDLNGLVTSTYQKEGRVQKRNKFTLGKNKADQIKACRFCAKSFPEVSFKNIAHAIPEFLGNTVLFSDYECDTCNESFSKYEWHLSAFIGILSRIFSGMEGKKGLPEYQDIKNKIKISRKGNLIDIHYFDDSGYKPITFTDDYNYGKARLKKPPYKPVEVIKGLTKIALTLLPETEISNFDQTKKWISDFTHEWNFDSFPIWYNINFELSFLPLRAMLLRRKNETIISPYMVFILLFPCGFIQIYLPNCSKDLYIHGKKSKMGPFPIYIAEKALDFDFKEMDLTQTVIDEDDSFDINNLGKVARKKFSPEESKLIDSLSQQEFEEYMDEHGEEI